MYLCVYMILLNRHLLSDCIPLRASSDSLCHFLKAFRSSCFPGELWQASETCGFCQITPTWVLLIPVSYLWKNSSSFLSSFCHQWTATLYKMNVIRILGLTAYIFLSFCSIFGKFLSFNFHITNKMRLNPVVFSSQFIAHSETANVLTWPDLFKLNPCIRLNSIIIPNFYSATLLNYIYKPMFVLQGLFQFIDLPFLRQIPILICKGCTLVHFSEWT